MCEGVDNIMFMCIKNTKHVSEGGGLKMNKGKR